MSGMSSSQTVRSFFIFNHFIFISYSYAKSVALRRCLIFAVRHNLGVVVTVWAPIVMVSTNL
jgi:hypothetical protein